MTFPHQQPTSPFGCYWAPTSAVDDDDDDDDDVGTTVCDEMDLKFIEDESLPLVRLHHKMSNGSSRGSSRGRRHHEEQTIHSEQINNKMLYCYDDDEEEGGQYQHDHHRHHIVRRRRRVLLMVALKVSTIIVLVGFIVTVITTLIRQQHQDEEDRTTSTREGTPPPSAGGGGGSLILPLDNHTASTNVNDVIDRTRIRSIYEAQEHMVAVDVGGGLHNNDNNNDNTNNSSTIYVWFRTWGNPSTDGTIPAVLFVHGGPGQAVVDYENGNERFFDPHRTFVVEVDQRGTGSSRPSVRDDYRNMRYYKDISVNRISADYEIVRTYLGIDSWVVWGGSYGSTVGLQYSISYPSSVLALILRGIYLDTVKEMNEVYTQNAFVNDPKKLADYMQLYSFAAKEATTHNRTVPDPNDSYRLVKEYEYMIVRGNRMATWQWYVFENNLMEEDPNNRFDPNVIVDDKFTEAQSLGYFETRLWLHESWENPTNLLAHVDRLANIPTWVCQGLRDKVCPPHNAQHLLNAMIESSPGTPRVAPLYGRFLQSGHEDTDPVMEECLIQSMNEFLDTYSKDERK